MVEMVETAAILNQATRRSLVILDEIGRGTATFDGLSIAWACLEHLHEVNACRALFATHFHELTALGDRLARLETLTLKVAEHRDGVVFLHEVVPGVAERSYGIQVAQLAGPARRVVARAGAILQEPGEGGARPRRPAPGSTTCRSSPPWRRRRRPNPRPRIPCGALLDAIDPDALTPREALDALYRLKRERAGRGPA